MWEGKDNRSIASQMGFSKDFDKGAAVATVFYFISTMPVVVLIIATANTAHDTWWICGGALIWMFVLQFIHRRLLRWLIVHITKIIDDDTQKP
jgi:hypothetical protein